MAQLILNQNTDTQMIFIVDNIFERKLDQTLNANKRVDLKHGEIMPIIPEIITQEINSVKAISNDGYEIPIMETYNRLMNFNSQYYEDEGAYTYNLDLKYIKE